MTNCLVADIGGTQARFALLSGSQLGPVYTIQVGMYHDAVQAIRHFLNCKANAAVIDSAIIAAAGPVSGGRCKLTNADWTLVSDDLKRTLGLSTVNIVNDLEALAWSVPRLASGDWVPVGRGLPVDSEPIAIVAPGTGLGMACFMPGHGGRVLASEGGHATLAATNSREAALIATLQKRYGHVSAERVLSGQGLVNVYAALAEEEGAHCPTPTPKEITQAAMDGSCPRSSLTLDLFCSWLGSVAGNAALMFGAHGGVYIAGGIVPELVNYLPRTNFRAQFESKGRLRPYLAHIPTRLVVRREPAFLGLCALAQRALQNSGPLS
jgi:glucokinase